MPLIVYVAGPYTGDEDANVKRAVDAANELFDAGCVPFVPHLSHHWEERSAAKRPWEAWLTWCLTWVGFCDVVLRLPGESKGAEIEESHARLLGIPVVRSVAEALAKSGSQDATGSA